MSMLQGNTYLMPIRIEDCEGNEVHASEVDKGEFVFGDIVKFYGAEGEVYWSDDDRAFIFPLTEEETFSLKKAVKYQGRVLLTNGAVSGSKPQSEYVYESIGTTRLSSGESIGEQSGKILTMQLLDRVLTVGGQGGTTNYNDLTNKPSINGVVLKGNKTTEDLGIVSEEKDPTVPQHVKDITERDISNWNNKSDFSGSYKDLTNKPTNVSEFNNDKGYATTSEVESAVKDKATTEYVDNEVDDVREVAEGKTKSFTISTLADLGTLLGIDTSVVADEYTITSTIITYKEQSIELKQGDLFLIVDTSVPDYWVSVDDMKIYKMETTKVDLTDYAKKDYVDGLIASSITNVLNTEV